VDLTAACKAAILLGNDSEERCLTAQPGDAAKPPALDRMVIAATGARRTGRPEAGSGASTMTGLEASTRWRESFCYHVGSCV